MKDGQRGQLKKRFLDAFSKCGVVPYACAQSGLVRSCHYAWLEKDHKYRQAFLEADAGFTESLIQEAVTRGRDGRPKRVIFQGKLMGRYLDMNGKEVPAGDPTAEIFEPLTVQEYSDNLLMFLIKAKRPEFRESHREPQPPPPDGAQTADDVFAGIDERAQAAAAPKTIEDAQLVNEPIEPEPPHGSNGKSA